MFSFQIFRLTCPGAPILIVPPHPHNSWQPAVKHGLPQYDTFEFSTVHVPTGTGEQGPGVNTPSAAAVAAAVAGFAIEIQFPKGGMFVMGAQSLIVAAGAPTIVFVWLVTLRVTGAVPFVQNIDAPDTT